MWLKNVESFHFFLRICSFVPIVYQRVIRGFVDGTTDRRLRNDAAGCVLEQCSRCFNGNDTDKDHEVYLQEEHALEEVRNISVFFKRLHFHTSDVLQVYIAFQWRAEFLYWFETLI